MKSDFLYSKNGKKFLCQEYYLKNKSFSLIAKENNFSRSMICKIFKYHKLKTRNKSEAQKLAIKIGRSEHPTLGKKISEENKIKISNSLKQKWKNATPEFRKKHSDKARENFLNIPEKTRKEYIKKSINTNRLVAAKDGSKLEKFIVKQLIKDNIRVILHKKHIIENEEMHIDIMLPEYSIAIEIDGFSHFNPIYGEEILNKRQKMDKIKNWLLISNGFFIIRLQFPKSYISQVDLRQMYEKLINTIKSIDTLSQVDIVKYNNLENRIIYIKLEI